MDGDHECRAELAALQDRLSGYAAASPLSRAWTPSRAGLRRQADQTLCHAKRTARAGGSGWPAGGAPVGRLRSCGALPISGAGAQLP